MSTLRITNTSVQDRFLLNLQRNYRNLAGTQEQIETGSTLNRASDNPLASAQARLRRTDLSIFADGKKAADNANSWINTAESGVNSLTQLVQRARELTVRMSNGTYDAAQLGMTAHEIDQMVQAAKQAVMGRSGDAYVFSGTATTTAPYDTNAVAPADDTYMGDENLVVRNVAETVNIQLNVQFEGVGGNAPLTARSLLGDGLAAGETPPKLLATLQLLSQHLRAGTPADVETIRTTDLQNLTANLEALTNASAALGGTQNRVDSAIKRLDQMAQITTEVLSDISDTDYAEAITQLNQQQTAYQASLQSGARLMQTSLMDFLR